MSKSFNEFVCFLKDEKAVEATIILDSMFQKAMRFIKEPIADGLQKLWTYQCGYGTNSLDFLTDKRIKLVGWVAYIGDKICIYAGSTSDLELIATGVYSKSAEAIKMFADAGVEINTLNAKSSSEFDFVCSYAEMHILSDVLTKADELYKAGKLQCSKLKNDRYANDYGWADDTVRVSNKAQELFLRGEIANMYDEEYGVKVPTRNGTWYAFHVEEKIKGALTMNHIADMMLQKPDWDKSLVDILLSDDDVRNSLANGYTFCDKVNEKIAEIRKSRKLQYVNIRQRVAIKEAIPESAKNVTVNFMGTDRNVHPAKFSTDCFMGTSNVFSLCKWECSASDRKAIEMYGDGNITLQRIVSISYRGKTIWENETIKK